MLFTTNKQTCFKLLLALLIYIQACTVIAMDESTKPSGKKRSHAQTEKKINRKKQCVNICRPCNKDLTCGICLEAVSGPAALQQYHLEEIKEYNSRFITILKFEGCATNIHGKITHFFHSNCLKLWWKKNQNHLCPICKKFLTVNAQTAEFFHLIRSLTISDINELIEEGCNIEVYNTHHETVLHYIINECNNSEKMLFLLNQGAYVNAKTLDGNTPLHYVARNRKIEMAKILLDYGADINAQNVQGKTPLFKAAFTGDAEMIDLLLTHGALDLQTNNGNTALHIASLGYLPPIDYHKKGMDKADIKEPIIQYMVRASDYLTIIQKMLSKYATLELLNILTEETDDPITRYIDTQNNMGDTPLHYAAEGGDLDIVRLLIKNGANTKIRNNQGHRAIHIASNRDVRDLLEAYS